MSKYLRYPFCRKSNLTSCCPKQTVAMAVAMTKMHTCSGIELKFLIYRLNWVKMTLWNERAVLKDSKMYWFENFTFSKKNAKF